MALPQDQTLNISFIHQNIIINLSTKFFCSSYSEIKIYNRSAAIVQGSIHKCNSWLTMWITILDFGGKNTFHGMGIIATVTPGAVFSKVNLA